MRLLFALLLLLPLALIMGYYVPATVDRWTGSVPWSLVGWGVAMAAVLLLYQKMRPWVYADGFQLDDDGY